MALRIEKSPGVVWFGDIKDRNISNRLEWYQNARNAVEFSDDSCDCLIAKNLVITMGRHVDNSIVVNDRSVSEFGCLLQGERTVWFFKTEKWFVKDTGSKNPIVVERKEKQKLTVPKDDGISKGLQLEDRDLLRIGNSYFVIRLN